MLFIILAEFIAFFYYTLGNLEPHLRSSPHGIQLLSVLPSPLVEKHGIDTVLEPFMTVIQELENVNRFERQTHWIISQVVYISVLTQDSGVTLDVSQPIPLHGSLIQCCSDNVAACGFKQLHSAFRKCQDCLAVADDMQCKVSGLVFVCVACAWDIMHFPAST